MAHVMSSEDNSPLIFVIPGIWALGVLDADQLEDSCKVRIGVQAFGIFFLERMRLIPRGTRTKRGELICDSFFRLVQISPWVLVVERCGDR